MIGLCLVFAGLVTGGLGAEEKVGTTLTLTGSLDAPYVYRSEEINTFHNGQLTPSDFILAPYLAVNMGYKLTGNVKAFAQFTNQPLTPFALGTAANAQLGGAVALTPVIRQAYIGVGEFFSPKLSLNYGVMDAKWTLRKGEGAFFLHAGGSQTPSLAIPLDMATAFRIPTLRGYAEFSGFAFNYGSLKDDNYAVNVLWGKTMETVVAVGAQRNADLLFGVKVDYVLPGAAKDNVLNVILAKTMNPAADMDIMTIGVGADYFGAMPNLELYGEWYTQSGDFGLGFDATGQATTVDHVASAYRFGAKYNLTHDLKPWVGLCLENRTGGNDSAVYHNTSLKYTENNHFVSYEDSQSTLILEDNLFGLDLDSNYNALKVEAGITTSLKLPGADNEVPLEVKALIGMFNLNEVPYTWNSGPNRVYQGGGGDDVYEKTKKGLGTEIDIVANLKYTEILTFTLGLGMLSGADYFGSIDIDDPNTNVGANKRLDDENFDSMTLVKFGLTVNF